jgi:hypothetical protein
MFGSGGRMGFFHSARIFDLMKKKRKSERKNAKVSTTSIVAIPGNIYPIWKRSESSIID